MKRKPVVVFVLFLGIAMCVWLLCRNNSTQTKFNASERNGAAATASAGASNITASPASKIIVAAENVARGVKREVQTLEAVERGKDEWRTPIQFYGKVVDENTNPVANAQVHFVWTDLSLSGNSEKETKSDRNGRFSLLNATGKNLIVQVSKEGYYPYEPSGLAFNYSGEKQNFAADASDPIIFRLRKKGAAEPLIHIQSPLGGAKGFRIARDGTPLEVSLTTGKIMPTGQGDLRVACWTDDQDKQSGQRYGWKCRLTVPNGGLLQYTDEFPFQAPLDGYKPSDEINMATNLANDWSRQFKANYFLKLANGNYARMSFEMVAAGDHFFKIESFLNPSGSANLEFDANNIIQTSN